MAWPRLPLRRLVVGTAFALLVAAMAGIAFAGRSFLPEFNEGALTVSAVTIPGTSLADSNALGNALERLLLSVPEVTSTPGAPAAPSWTSTRRVSSRLRLTCA